MEVDLAVVLGGPERPAHLPEGEAAVDAQREDLALPRGSSRTAVRTAARSWRLSMIARESSRPSTTTASSSATIFRALFPRAWFFPMLIAILTNQALKGMGPDPPSRGSASPEAESARTNVSWTIFSASPEQRAYLLTMEKTNARCSRKRPSKASLSPRRKARHRWSSRVTSVDGLSGERWGFAAG